LSLGPAVGSDCGCIAVLGALCLAWHALGTVSSDAFIANRLEHALPALFVPCRDAINRDEVQGRQELQAIRSGAHPSPLPSRTAVDGILRKFNGFTA
jgi:hypothetical protein